MASPVKALDLRRSRVPAAARSRRGDSTRTDDLDALATLMDGAFAIPGTRVRFGLDAILGLLPGIGDLLSGLISLYILNRAHQAGISRATIFRMAINVGLDALVGAIPIAGDLFDVAFKANRRNVDLLRRRLEEAPTKRTSQRRGDYAFVAGILIAIAIVLVAAAAGTFYLVRALFALGS